MEVDLSTMQKQDGEEAHTCIASIAEWITTFEEQGKIKQSTQLIPTTIYFSHMINIKGRKGGKIKTYVGIHEDSDQQKERR